VCVCFVGKCVLPSLSLQVVCVCVHLCVSLRVCVASTKDRDRVRQVQNVLGAVDITQNNLTVYVSV
jgi:hypothetical protein